MELTKDVSVPEKILVDFDVKSEDWNVFQLADDSTLKIKFVLVNVFAKRVGKGFEAALQGQNVLGIFAPEDLRGAPSESYTKEELAKAIVKDDVDVRKVVQQQWNEYELKNGLSIKVKIMPVHIKRTSKFDREGMPIYFVDTTAFVKGKMLKRSKSSK